MTQAPVNSPEEAFAHIKQHLTNIAGAERFMVAVWEVKDEKVMLIGRTTYNFPIGDLRVATTMLVNDMREVVEKAAEPLPIANMEEVTND